MVKDDITKLTHLGSNVQYQFEEPSVKILETFPNQQEEEDSFLVTLTFPEFTSLCPKTGQPDFADFTVKYVPDKVCLESKSVKLYFFAFRNHGAFMESITNKVLRDFVEVCQPRWMRVVGNFAPRGALSIAVAAEYDSTLGFYTPSTILCEDE
jgi:7-cyano-7-deazaguanine reductase